MADAAPPPAADTPAAAAPAADAAPAAPDLAPDAAPAASAPAAEAAAAEPAPAEPAPAEPAAKAEAPQDPPSLLSSATGDAPAPPAPEGQPDAKADAKPPEKDGTDEKAKTEEAKSDPDTTDATPKPLEDQAPALSIDDFVFPEGADKASEGAKSFIDIVNNRDLSLKDRTQQFLDLHKAEIDRVHQSYAEHQRRVWGDLNTGWQNELRNDPEIGGNRLHTNLSLAKGVIEHFLSPQDSAALLKHADANGMGNFLPFIRLLARMGRQSQIFEDGLVVAPSPPARPQRGPGNRGWYDNTKFSNGGS